MKRPFFRKPLFLACVSLSLIAHGWIVFFLYKKEILRYRPNLSLFTSSKNPHKLPYENEELVEDSFSELVVQTLPTTPPPEPPSSREKDFKPWTPWSGKIQDLELPPGSGLSWDPSLNQPSTPADAQPPNLEPNEQRGALPFAHEFAGELDGAFSEEVAIDHSGEPVKRPSLLPKQPQNVPILLEPELNSVLDLEFDQDLSITHPENEHSEQPLLEISPLFQPEEMTIDPPQFLELRRNFAQSAPIPPLFMDPSTSENAPSPPPYLLSQTTEELRTHQWNRGSFLEKGMATVEFYGLNEEATGQIVWEDNLEADVALLPHPGGKGYLFSLSLKPNFDESIVPLKQNIYFLIDRSNSIEKSRFGVFKRGVERALPHLNEKDNFNIILFDKEVVRLSDRHLQVNAQNIQLAQDFLARQDYKSHFSASDLYQSLDKLIPDPLDENELNVLILLSDGQTLLDSKKQKKAIAQWLKKKQGRVVCYTAAAGKDTQLVLLDLLSYSTGGKLLYSDTHAGFPRKLVRFVKELQTPLLTSVAADGIVADPEVQLSLQPNRAPLPSIFEGRPLTLIGTISQPSDFTLFIQGKNGDRWFNIKKQISFADAKKGGRNLEKHWAILRANHFYDLFLEDGRGVHLSEAKNLLLPYQEMLSE